MPALVPRLAFHKTYLQWLTRPQDQPLGHASNLAFTKEKARQTVLLCLCCHGRKVELQARSTWVFVELQVASPRVLYIKRRDVWVFTNTYTPELP